MRLAQALETIDVQELVGTTDREITGIAYDSRQVVPGDLFVAMRGTRADGHDFIRDAIGRGAAAVITERMTQRFSDTPVVLVADARTALAHLSAHFFSDPSRDMTLIGVTGTNGKTTTSFLIESMLKEDGQKTGVIGTVNYRFADQVLPAPTTTPQSYEIQRLLRDMEKQGIVSVVMEVSSHALDQSRVAGCHFNVGVFTNLSPEHLDYHGDMHSYFAAKKRFFTEILQKSAKESRAVLNADDPWLEDLTRNLPTSSTITFGLERGTIRAVSHTFSLEGINAVIETPAGPLSVASRLIGEYNLYNVMAAVGVGIALGLSLDTMQRGVSALSRVPGRMERVGIGKPTVLVDYAHTPDALEQSLRALRHLVEGRLLVVFGCGGDRDRTKRPRMGRIAVKWADKAIITSDNPRTENPLAIIDDITAGLVDTPTERYVIVADRREAIDMALTLAAPSDVVLIAGKGHEDYQIIGTHRHHFDDREEIQRVLTAGIEGARK